MNIIKRSGEEVEYDGSRIINAIKKANNDVPAHERLSDLQAKVVEEQVRLQIQDMTYAANVEEIQDMVIKAIMAQGAFELAKVYTEFRYKHMLIRKSNSTDDSILSLLDQNNEELKQENSNKNPMIASTQRDYMAGEVSKDITDRILLPEDIVKANNEAEIHFHDRDYFAMHIHNCFTGYTEFVTDRGIRKFSSFNDGDTVIVKDKDGIFREATVRCYGDRTFNKVTFKAGKRTKVVYCTPDHRWLLSDGTVTTKLKVNDVLIDTPDSRLTDDDLANLSFDEARLFCIGFAIGDGCDANGGTRIRLCGDKNKYAPIFEKAGYHKHASIGNDSIYWIKDSFKQDFINGKAWRILSAHEKALVFTGYYRADGSENTNRITTNDERLCLFIEETADLAGYYISSHSTRQYSTNYKANAVAYYYHLTPSVKQNLAWKVVDIRKSAKSGLAWCVEEPVTHSFMLSDGMVTGNCDLINLEDMLQNGTVISGTMIDKPKSLATACNIATQIIAQVASNQYGQREVA